MPKRPLTPDQRKRKYEQAREYNARPDVKARRRAYRKRPDVREHERAYARTHRSDPAVRSALNAKRRAYHARPDIRQRTLERDRVYKYDLTPTQFQSLLEHQNHQCGICCAPLTPRCAVDHDHATGAVRGLLCNACNAGIGFLGDTLTRVLRAAVYLHRPPAQ